MPPPNRPYRRRRRPAMRSEEQSEAALATAIADIGAGQALVLPDNLTVKELADLVRVSPVDVIKELIKNGIMATINQVIDFDTAAIVASDLGYEVREATGGTEEVAEEEPQTREQVRSYLAEVDGAPLQDRSPVVTVMGHVDHGKTSILDSIRSANVTAAEAGGITQHIGAYQVDLDGRTITFIDTPGHEAFTTMRARGAMATDVAILVVAADDGVMPQTREALSHARAAGVPIVVAVNKMDLEDANPDRVKQQLSELGLIPEEWGGDTPFVPVSAKTADGIKDLLENIAVQAEVLELKANPDRPAVGVVLEAELDTMRGPKATLLVQTGTLRTGDSAIVGDTWGRIRAMFDQNGQRVDSARPSVPVAVLGVNEVPNAGDIVSVVQSEREARAHAEARQRVNELEADKAQRPVSLDTLFGEMSSGKVKELNIIVRTDVQGTMEAVKQALEGLSNDEVKVKIIHAATGNVSESDVMLATASNGIVVGFNAKVEGGAKRQADVTGVEIRTYRVIYELIEDVEKAMTGMLEPIYADVVEGHAEVRQVFKARRGSIAGCLVMDGTINRTSLCRVTRGGEVLHQSRIESLRRFKDDVREVTAGLECGISVDGFNDFAEGDAIEAYRSERQR
ncbi:MAG: translation initiation factor IF-2 [Dehalococcoidia bacterium]|nr:translation initiation factor IF-2 [Dehalococcoidia bacterium]